MESILLQMSVALTPLSAGWHQRSLLKQKDYDW